jgi:hypothetical protein
MSESWLRSEGSRRWYKIDDGTIWEVINEYQELKFATCSTVIYGRATSIFHYEGKGKLVPELHNNYAADLSSLKSLQVTYGNGGAAISEVNDGSGWTLLRAGQIMGHEIEMS